MKLFEVQKANVSNLLSDRFVVPPFTVFNCTQGYWQDRKRSWTKLGIQSELGRDGDELSHTTKGGRKQPQMAFTRSTGFTDAAYAEKFGRKPTSQTSIFDPVLCEIAYKWFSREGDTVFDPFAGGSVRGIVAGSLGRKYVGIDLSEKQILANRVQYEEISNNYGGIEQPIWIVGDSTNLVNIVEREYNMIFSCPPYYNLEVYSTNDADLSYKPTYAEFLETYRKIINDACKLLAADSFAIFVVSNFRDGNGAYYNFVGDTISAFMDAECMFYNDCVIIKPAGTLPIRVPIQFNSARKIGKQHENFLVFYKGNPDHIKEKFGLYESAD